MIMGMVGENHNHSTVMITILQIKTRSNIIFVHFLKWFLNFKNFPGEFLIFFSEITFQPLSPTKIMACLPHFYSAMPTLF